jgi:predicted O-methyltransferase YrrM
MATVTDRFAEACITPSDIYEHLPVLRNLAVRMRAQRIIELGVRGGNSTWAWLEALGETEGHLWCVDIDPLPAEVARLAGDMVTFVQGDDCSPVVLDQLPTEVDIVFIDTDHTYALTYAEVQTYLPRIRPGGRLVLHDTAVRSFPHHAQPGYASQPRYPVCQALEDATNGRYRIGYRDNCNGLAVVEVP